MNTGKWAGGNRPRKLQNGYEHGQCSINSLRLDRDESPERTGLAAMLDEAINGPDRNARLGAEAVDEAIAIFDALVERIGHETFNADPRDIAQALHDQPGGRQ